MTFDNSPESNFWKSLDNFSTFSKYVLPGLFSHWPYIKIWTNGSARICIGNHVISSAIWDKSARVNFSKANQIARARRASAICSLWKIYECWFFPNCTRNIMWLLDNNTHTKISPEVDDKQNVFSGLPFRFVLKHNGVAGLCKIQIQLRNFKSPCHALSGAFILIQLYWFGLKCPTSTHACNISSLRVVA